jgi:hypothetical protein
MRKIIKNLALFICCAISLSCNGQSKPATDFSILGTWRMIGKFSIDSYPLTSREKKECIGDNVIFMQDTIIAQNDSCLYSEGCKMPNYNFHKLKIPDLFKSDDNAKSEEEHFKMLLKYMGFKQDSINVIITTCGAPYSPIFILNSKQIAFGWNDYLFWFERVSNKN